MGGTITWAGRGAPGVAGVLALLAALAGCGSSSAPAPTTSARPEGTRLEIAYAPRGPGGPTRTVTLTCEPPGGSHPDPAGACRVLAARPGLLDPPPPGQVCTQIYGGPQTATVRGTLAGAPVSAELARRDGCEIARWDAAGPLLATLG